MKAFVTIGFFLCCAKLVSSSETENVDAVEQVESEFEDEAECQVASETYKRHVYGLLRTANAGDNQMTNWPDWSSKMLEVKRIHQLSYLERIKRQRRSRIVGDCFDINILEDDSLTSGVESQYCTALLTYEYTDDLHDMTLDDECRNLSRSTRLFLRCRASWPSSCTASQTEGQFASMLRMLNVSFDDVSIELNSCYVPSSMNYVVIAIATGFTFTIVFTILVVTFLRNWNRELIDDCDRIIQAKNRFDRNGQFNYQHGYPQSY